MTGTAASADALSAEKPRRKRGAIAVYEELREDILWVRVEPGSALDEVALAERFELSRTPVREALVMLAGEDLVTFLQNRTTIVAPHKLDNMAEYLDTHLLLARAVARSAAVRRDDDDLRRIIRAKEAYEKVVGSDDVNRIFAADLELHRQISRACHNSFARKFHDMSLDYGRRSHILHYYAVFGDAERQDSLREHDELVGAIEAGDADGSDAAIARHVRSELEVMIRTLQPTTGLEMDITDFGSAARAGGGNG